MDWVGWRIILRILVWVITLIGRIIMPNYVAPNFNVVADLWSPPAVPSTSAPTFTAIACQIYTYSRTPQLMFHPGSGRWLPVIIVRLPFGFPIVILPDMIFKSGATTTQGPDYHKVQYIQRLHVGFPNQYYACYCLQCNANGTIPKTPLPT
jgi:hypothetical protein